MYIITYCFMLFVKKVNQQHYANIPISTQMHSNTCCIIYKLYKLLYISSMTCFFPSFEYSFSFNVAWVFIVCRSVRCELANTLCKALIFSLLFLSATVTFYFDCCFTWFLHWNLS